MNKNDELQRPYWPVGAARFLMRYPKQAAVALIWGFAVSVVYSAKLIHWMPDFAAILQLTFPQTVVLTLFITIFLEGWILRDEITVMTRSVSSIRVFKAWSEEQIQSDISSAKKSIVIVDSYFDEASNLSSWVRAALDAGAKTLDVSVYLVSRETLFGAQRRKEQQKILANNLSASDIEALTNPVTDDQLQEYREDFASHVREIRRRLSQYKQVNLAVYEYPAMPSIRLIVVDDTTFVFGWFPLSAFNPEYMCFCLHDHPLADSDHEVVSRLREQLENIRAISALST
jgi:hypothetical protein